MREPGVRRGAECQSFIADFRVTPSTWAKDGTQRVLCQGQESTQLEMEVTPANLLVLSLAPFSLYSWHPPSLAVAAPHPSKGRGDFAKRDPASS